MTIRQIAQLTVVLAVATTACGASDGVAPAGTITPEELAQRIDGGDPPFILDVRSAEEFEAGHIPGAVNIPHTELAARIDDLPAASAEELVVHCERGGRAAAAADILGGAGYSGIRDLNGHMLAWREGGYPVE